MCGVDFGKFEEGVCRLLCDLWGIIGGILKKVFAVCCVICGAELVDL
jgi:hypothetical protein